MSRSRRSYIFFYLSLALPCKRDLHLHLATWTRFVDVTSLKLRGLIRAYFITRLTQIYQRLRAWTTHAALADAEGLSACVYFYIFCLHFQISIICDWEGLMRAPGFGFSVGPSRYSLNMGEKSVDVVWPRRPTCLWPVHFRQLYFGHLWGVEPTSLVSAILGDIGDQRQLRPRGPGSGPLSEAGLHHASAHAPGVWGSHGPHEVTRHDSKQVSPIKADFHVTRRPHFSSPERALLEAAFDALVDVSPIDSGDFRNLGLLERPDLGVTFTKLHCWKLTQYTKCVFLDADTLVCLVSLVRLASHVDNLHVGIAGGEKLRRAFWPRRAVRGPRRRMAGLFQLRRLRVRALDGDLQGTENEKMAMHSGWPRDVSSSSSLQSLMSHAMQKGSFDGGDQVSETPTWTIPRKGSRWGCVPFQGLLNTYFSGWASEDISRHLSFAYNMCATASYTYMPAYRQWVYLAFILRRPN